MQNNKNFAIVQIMKSDKHKRYLELREKFPEFEYKGFFKYEEDCSYVFEFHYKAGDEIEFFPTWKVTLNDHFQSFTHLPDITNILLNLGMVEMISYWKAFCSPVIKTSAIKLTPEQKSWWKKLFRHGLAEFFHVNGIPQPGTDLFRFKSTRKASYFTDPFRTFWDDDRDDRVLLPVGGGKDSVISLEMVKAMGKKPVPFVVNPRKATDQVIKAAGFEWHQCVTIERQIDPLLLELNKKGYLNGHTPFSALLAFAALFVAQMAKIGTIALSNESSANEATVPGTKINHQYSKSYEFEKDIRTYVNNYIDKNVNYFSLLRPLNELQIAERFSRHKKHHRVFKSCNVGSKEDIWCCNCSKCLFTYIILAPFLEAEKLIKIFGENLFENEDLGKTLDALTGGSAEKPFECVGTLKEVNVALCALIDKHESAGVTLPLLLARYKNSEQYHHYKEINIKDVLNEFNKEHFVKDEYLDVLMKRKV